MSYQDQRVFGWSYPPGVSRLPWDDEPPMPWQELFRCEKCGKWASNKTPTTKENHQTMLHCDGKWNGFCEPLCCTLKEHEPHDFIDMAWTVFTWTCPKCGHSSTFNDL